MCPYWGSANGRTVWLFDCDRTEGRCQAFCPRMPYDQDALRGKFFDPAENDPDVGPFKALYLVRSADPADREGAQHGGTVTALLKLALAEGLIDAAVLNHMKDGDPEGFLATSAEDVMACRGSSFRIAPTLAVLNRALKEDSCKKIAVVGTACKTLATYKMLAKPLPDRDNNAGNIALVIGLFCGWGLDWEGLKALAAKHMPLEEIAHMDIPPSKYHCLVLRAKDGREVSIDLDDVTPLVRPACRACEDMTAEFADISVGSGRSADGWDVDKGWNELIVRSEKGEKLLGLAREKGVLEFKPLPEGALAKLKRAAAGKRSKAAK
jgi:coenzyme F420 hydrogenase subunit beta